ncbi:hypothetical protein BV95_03824 [Sphingobium chlorophenolicum]|uniref:Uncharacterized protein n=1 Tax=Sphingobium chlorophenolicum TaxID=46429 RepID=A0A081R9L4_SPHCR|nr:hypothetical protein BV95_03824 [Sphingobium chlorophenolicum]
MAFVQIGEARRAAQPIARRAARAVGGVDATGSTDALRRNQQRRHAQPAPGQRHIRRAAGAAAARTGAVIAPAVDHYLRPDAALAQCSHDGRVIYGDLPAAARGHQQSRVAAGPGSAVRAVRFEKGIARAAGPARVDGQRCHLQRSATRFQQSIAAQPASGERRHRLRIAPALGFPARAQRAERQRSDGRRSAGNQEPGRPALPAARLERNRPPAFAGQAVHRRRAAETRRPDIDQIGGQIAAEDVDIGRAARSAPGVAAVEGHAVDRGGRIPLRRKEEVAECQVGAPRRAQAAFHRHRSAQPVAAAPGNPIVGRSAPDAICPKRKIPRRRKISVAGIEQDRPARPVRTICASSAAAVGIDAAEIVDAIGQRKAAPLPARRAGEQRHAAARSAARHVRRIARRTIGADVKPGRAEAAARRADADRPAHGIGRSRQGKGGPRKGRIAIGVRAGEQVLRDGEAAPVMCRKVDAPAPQDSTRRPAAKDLRFGIERNGFEDVQRARPADIDIDAGSAGDHHAIAAAVGRMAGGGADVREQARPLMRAAGYGHADIAAGRAACGAGACHAGGRLGAGVDDPQIERARNRRARCPDDGDIAANGIAAIDRRLRNLKGGARRRVERGAAEAQRPAFRPGRSCGGQRRQGDRAARRIAGTVAAVTGITQRIGRQARRSDQAARRDQVDGAAAGVRADQRRRAGAVIAIAVGVQRQVAADVDLPVGRRRAAAAKGQQVDPAPDSARPGGQADGHVGRDRARLVGPERDAPVGGKRDIAHETGRGRWPDDDIAGRNAGHVELPIARSDAESGLRACGGVGRGDRIAESVVTDIGTRRQYDRTADRRRGGRRRIADIARQQHGQRIILRHRHHIDALGVAAPVGGRACGHAAMHHAVGVGRSGGDGYVEQAAVDGDVGGFRPDIGRRAVDGHGPRLHHARRHQRDIAARAQRVDPRTRLHLYRRIAARRAAEADFAIGAIEADAVGSGQVDIVGGEHQRSHIEDACRPGNDAAGRIEPDAAARIGLHRAVQPDDARQGHAVAVLRNAVQHREGRYAGTGAELAGAARRQEVDDSRPVGVGRRPIDDHLPAIDRDDVGRGPLRDRCGAERDRRIALKGGLRGGGHGPAKGDHAGATAQQAYRRTGAGLVHHYRLHGASCVVIEKSSRVPPRSVWKPALRSGVASVRSIRA